VVEVDGNRADIALRLVEPTILNLSVPRELIAGEGIARGDSLSVELNPSMDSITKVGRT